MRTAALSLAMLSFVIASCTTIGTIPPQVVTAADPEPRSVLLSAMCAEMGWTYESGPGAFDYRAKGPRGDVMTFTIGKDSLSINGTRWRQERDAVDSRGNDLLLPESTHNFIVKHFRMHHLVRNGRQSAMAQYVLEPIEPAAAPAAVERTPVKATSETLRGLTICIDPGHGGKDMGGEAHGVSEKHICLAVSLKLRDLCEAAGAKVVMTRTTDTYPDLDSRVHLANTCGADLFISVHANIAPNNDQVTGFEAFYNPQSASGERFARNLCAAINAVTDAPSRGAKKDPRGLRVLEKTTVTAVLFELGFLSNRAEGKRLTTDAYQTTLAKGLFNGIVADWRSRPRVSR